MFSSSECPKGVYVHQNPTVSPDATFFIPASVINTSAEVCRFVPLGHVYYAVFIVDTNLQSLALKNSL